MNARAAARIALVAAAMPAALHGQAPTLATVVQRAGVYAAAFERALSNVVTGERYAQDVTRATVVPGRFATDSHRELRSDFLLVQPRGTDWYIAFRDVFEVDGRPVRDRQDRLTALFLDPTASAEAQIQRINQESARYNIGNIERTINTPTLPLLFLLPQNQPRFRFTRGAARAPGITRSARASRGGGAASFAVPADAWVIEYEEIARPTLIRTTRGLDLPSHGRFWTDPATGRVLISELISEDATVRATIDVAYQWDPFVPLMVPAEMRERYQGRGDGATIEGDATYGKIRQFQVQATERLGRAEQSQIEQPAVTAVDRPSAPAVEAATIDPGVAEPATNPPTTSEPLARPPAVIAQDLPQLRPFRTGTELVLVDFVVTDKADHPVGGLSTRDFRVREDGKERPIVSLEAFAGDDLTPAGRDQALDAPVRKTARSPNATTVLLVDDGQTWMSSSASPAASPRSIRI